MAKWGCVLLLLLTQLLSMGQAAKFTINEKDGTNQVCSGMYSRKSWGGNTDPHILVKFAKINDLPEDVDPTVAMVMFEWHDKDLIGETFDNSSYVVDWLCDEHSFGQGDCNENNTGTYILAEDALSRTKSKLDSEAIHLGDPPAVTYPVTRTGYYCVVTARFKDTDTYTAYVEFRNAFGQLPAAQIAKLPFYAAITVVYAFVAMAWGALYWFNRHDILAVQNYITAILAFLVVEMFMTWLFYDYQNRHGFNTGAKALLVIDSILSAGRNSFSFFLLLIVCMGYGVVKPTLGKTMIYVRWLAITHFVFGVLYATASLSVAPENAGPLVLLVVLPLAATLTAFYVWTLNSLGATMKDLAQRKQTVKAGMYRKLWWCILLSIIVIFVFFFVNSWTFAGQRDEDFVPNHWQTRWFILDGWLNLVYFADVAFVAYVWRPTANNRRFAMSDEIAQDDEGFEIASIRDSFDIDDDALTPPDSKPPGYTAAGYAPPGGSGSSNVRRDVSPLPAPVPTKPTPLPRESLDGDTIFAVGDEDADKFSDDEGDGSDDGRGEESKLTKHKD